MTRLMASVLTVYELGGWSDAIHWSAIPPSIRISPIGEIQVGQAFMNEVCMPFFQVGGETESKDARDSYGCLYSQLAQPVSAAAEVLAPRFVAAWDAEFGVSLPTVKSSHF